MEQHRKDRLVTKGRNVPVNKLLEQGRAHVLLCRKYGEDLGNTGWPATRTDDLDQKLFALDALYSGRSQQSESALKATGTESAARQAAKAFVRRLRLAVPLVLKETPVEGVTENAFNTGERLGHSTPRISKYLMTVRPFVQKMEEHLKLYFGGKSPLTQLETVKTDLDKADAAQETARGALPKETADLYLLAGEILDEIETVNRIAKIAFDGNAEIIGQFNKDLTLRARRTKKSAASTDDDEESEAM